MNKSVISLLSIAGVAVALASCQSAGPKEYPGMPEDIAAELRDIGPIIEGQRTTALYAPQFGPEDYEGKIISRDVAYGPHERHVLDVFTESNSGSKPVVVFVHGGGFAGGAKSSPNSPFYDNILNWAVDNDMVGVSINYRLIPEVSWPSGIEDMTRVVNFLVDNIDDYGGDPEQIFLWGHSAGASLVGDYIGWQASHGMEDKVAGGILTTGYYVLGPEVDIWANYYGDDLSTYEERSSLSGLLMSDTPLFANDAELDPENFKIDTTQLVEAFEEAGKPLTIVHLKGHSHLSETYAVGTDDQSLSGPVKDFIEGVVGR